MYYCCKYTVMVSLMTRIFPRFLLYMLAAIWLVGLMNTILGGQLNQLGLFPREVHGLQGILFSPFLHGSIGHLVNNSILFVFLGFFVALYNQKGRHELLRITVFVGLLGGVLTWLFARTSFHIGLSGIIFGYWGFITVNGLVERSFKSIFISTIAVIFYGGMVFGLLPLSPYISFESHIFGALSGVIYSYLYRRNR